VHVNPSAGTVAILLTQVAADGPVAPDWMRGFWRYTAGACGRPHANRAKLCLHPC
jgi:hypothetical protein